MNIGQQHRTIASRRHRANAQRRPHYFAIDDRRSCVPLVAALDRVETRQGLHRAVSINAQNACIVGTNKDQTAKGNATGKREIAFCYRSPCAVGDPSAHRPTLHYGEYAALSVGHQTANRLVREFLMERFAIKAM